MGLPQEALDWRPAEDMSSLAVLVVHTAGVERYWIGDLAGHRVRLAAPEAFAPMIQAKV